MKLLLTLLTNSLYPYILEGVFLILSSSLLGNFLGSDRDLVRISFASNRTRSEQVPKEIRISVE